MDKQIIVGIVRNLIAEKPSDREIDLAIPQAMGKYKRIIEREGDANGARRTEEYFAQLVADIIREQRFCDLISTIYTVRNDIKKMSAAEADAQTQHQNHTIDVPIRQGVTFNFIFEGAL